MGMKSDYPTIIWAGEEKDLSQSKSVLFQRRVAWYTATNLVLKLKKGGIQHLAGFSIYSTEDGEQVGERARDPTASEVVAIFREVQEEFQKSDW